YDNRSGSPLSRGGSMNKTRGRDGVNCSTAATTTELTGLGDQLGGPACGLSGSCVERYRGSLQQTMPVRLGSLGFRRINPGRLDTSNAAAEKVVPPVHPNLQQPTIHGCAHCSPSIQGRPWWALHLHLH
ncbi:hypothetical protein CLAIMM_13264 isoform 1, partial [Cladophialophora immunda]